MYRPNKTTSASLNRRRLGRSSYNRRLPRKRAPRPFLIGGLALAAVVVFASLVYTLIASGPIEAVSAKTALKAGASQGLTHAEPAAVKEPSLHEITVKENDTLYGILARFDVPGVEILSLAVKAKEVYDLSRLNKGDVISVSTLDGAFQGLEYRYKALEALVVTRQAGAEGGGYRVEKYEVPHRIEPTLSYGTIESTLYEAGIKSGVGPEIIETLSDIFAWDVDFATDIRKGDTFSVLYEIIYVDGKRFDTGRILGARMTNAGRQFNAVWFVDAAGRGDYYDTNGKSLSRTLLKSPLRYRRISSRFTRKRYHPILKKYRPHHGVDYAAPSGTPVESAGDGKIVFAGWKKGYGRFVKIRHNSIYTSAYGHMSRIKKGIKKNTRVRQGQVIGYVGSTGLSTGPHLHYEVSYKGRLVNPLKLKSSSRKRLKGDLLESFTALSVEVQKKLQSADQSMVARLGSADTPGSGSL